MYYKSVCRFNSLSLAEFIISFLVNKIYCFHTWFTFFCSMELSGKTIVNLKIAVLAVPNCDLDELKFTKTVYMLKYYFQLYLGPQLKYSKHFDSNIS